MNNTEQPVATVNPQLDAGTSLLSLLPIVVRDENCIVIYHLPANLTYEKLENSPILNTCHQMKHLYSDGDRVGRKGIAKKRAHKKRLENNTIRMCISYTCSLRKEPAGTKMLTINFMPSFTKHHLPRFIQRINKADLTPKELEEMQVSGQIIGENRRSVIIERNMNNREVAEQMDIFIGTCREEISNYLASQVNAAIESATTSAINAAIAFA